MGDEEPWEQCLAHTHQLFLTPILPRTAKLSTVKEQPLQDTNEGFKRLKVLENGLL